MLCDRKMPVKLKGNMTAPVQPVRLPILNAVNLLFVILYSNLCVDAISLTMHHSHMYTAHRSHCTSQ